MIAIVLRADRFPTLAIVPSGRNAMTSADAKSAGQSAPSEMYERNNHLLGNWKFWLALATVALVAAAALNWGWLIAVGLRRSSSHFFRAP